MAKTSKAANTAAAPDPGAQAQEEARALAFMERIRAIEYERLVLERKFDQAEALRLELVTGHRDEIRDLLAQAGEAEARLRREIAFLGTETGTLSGELRQARETLARERDERRAADERAGDLAAKLASAAATVRALEQECRESGQREAAHLAAVQALEQGRRDDAAAASDAQASLMARIADRDARLDEGRREAARLEQVSQALRDELAQAQALASGLREQLAANETRLQRSGEDLAERGQQLAGREKELALVAQTLVRTEANLAETRRWLDDATDQLAVRDRQVATLEDSLAQLRASISLGLGMALTEAMRSWSGLRRLPGRLWTLQAQARQTRRSVAAAGSGALPLEARVDALLQRLAQDGLDAAREQAAADCPDPHERAHALTALARQLSGTDPGAAIEIGKEAHALDPAAYRTKWLAFLHYDAGRVTEAARWLAKLPGDAAMRASERAKARQVTGSARLLERLPELPPRVPATRESRPRRVLYLAASALPFHQSGYTLRTQAVCAALAAAGAEVLCATRSGYPGDRPDALPGPEQETWVVAGVTYRRLAGQGRHRVPTDQYLDEAAAAVSALIEEWRPGIVHAASNHENALPALIAARRAGLPFVYEVRGLWELTAASRVPGWQDSERFALERSLESLVAGAADRVLALNRGLADELVRRGIDPARISLAPNAVDAGLEPLPPSPDLAATLGFPADADIVGYAGSLVAYEGLDDLLSALALLAPTLPRLRLLVIGDGDQLTHLQAQAERLGIADRVRFTGRIGHAEVPAHLALCRAIALPRKPVAVCDMVSPLKPLEAMALGVPVLASDVAAMKELVEHDRTGLLHRAGDPADLAQALLRLLSEPGLDRRLAEAAAAWVRAERTWDQMAAGVCQVHRELLGPEGAAGEDPLDGLLLPLPPGRSALTTEEKSAWQASLATAHARGGPALMARLVARQADGRNPRFLAYCLLKAADRCLNDGDATSALDFAGRATAASDDASTLRGAAQLHFNAGDDAGALALLERREATGVPRDDTVERLESQVRGRLQLFQEAGSRQPEPQVLPVARRSTNFLHFSLPYTSVGYATRSHGIAQGVRDAGWDLRPCTRPGFPGDFKPELADQAIPEFEDVDGLRYRRLADGGRRGMSETHYLLAAADRMEAVLRDECPAVVHAASNYSTALPALVAARRLGLPFVYEIRGFWEITRSSRDAAFEKSAKFRAMQLYEDLVVREADHVITITAAMKQELVERGVPAARISLAYNSVDPERFRPLARDEALADRLGIPAQVPVIGYVGSFVDYEGLDDLVLAAARLRDQGVPFRLLLVGDGAVMASLRQQIDDLGLQELAILTGRVPHEEVESYYSLIDIAPFPRKPWQVCELVSPLKPFEAMAMQKPVVVSATRALLEIVSDGDNGFVFAKGDAEDLARVLARLAADPGLRQRTGERAREWVVAHRSWRRAGQDVVEAYGRLLQGGR